MATRDVTLAFPTLTTPFTPQFDAVAYEAQGPLDAYAAGPSAWQVVSVDDYMLPAPPTPPDVNRSLTPSPVGGLGTAYAAMAAPAYIPPPPPMPRMSFDVFLAQLPPTMAPGAITLTYLTENGLMRFYAFAEADGVTQVCMTGAATRLQGISADRYRRAAPPSHLPMPQQPQGTYWHRTLAQPAPQYPTAMPTAALFESQADYLAAVAGPSQAPAPKRKARKSHKPKKPR